MTQKILLSLDDLEKRWGISKSTLRRMINENKLKRVKGFSEIHFNIRDILKYEESGDIDPLSPLERRRLEIEIQNKDKEIERLNSILTKIITPIGEYIGGLKI